MDERKFNSWLATYTPLKREVHGTGYPDDIRGRSFTELHAYRYRHTLRKFTEAIILQPGDSVLDIGPYPGGWASLLQAYYGQQLEIDLIGLGMSPEFRGRLNAPNIRFIDFDIDIENPACKNPGREIPLEPKRYRAAFLLETIEHLFNPLPVLQRIRDSLTRDGRLLLTTDNPLWFGYAYQAIFRRKSPWGPVQESHLFNQGDWRPHIRLYTLADLGFLLERVGLRVISATYFNDHFGLHSLRRGKLKFRFGLKPILSKLLPLPLPDRLRANRLLVIAGADDGTVKSG